MAKTGRPPDTGKTRNCNIRFRVDSDFFNELSEYCVLHNKSISNVVRNAVNGYINKEKDFSAGK